MRGFLKVRHPGVTAALGVTLDRCRSRQSYRKRIRQVQKRESVTPEMLDLEPGSFQLLLQLFLFIPSRMTRPRVVPGPLTHVGGNGENQRSSRLEQLQPLSQTIQVLFIVLQHFKCNDEIESFFAREEVFSPELNGSRPKVAELKLGSQLGV